MSEKKDWHDKRKYRKRWWGPDSAWKYDNSYDGRRWTRARVRQLMREGEYVLFPKYRRDAGYYYW